MTGCMIRNFTDKAGEDLARRVTAVLKRLFVLV